MGTDLASMLVAASADMNAVTTPDGVYRYVSPACTRLFGWQTGDLEGANQVDFVHPEDRATVLPVDTVPNGRVASTILPPAGPAPATSYRFRCADGSYRWVESTSRRVETRGESFVVIAVRDITQRRESEAHLLRLASTDPLTGVANRTVLMDRLDHALRRRETGVLAVLFLDLDHFKIINDSRGHRVGDGVLLEMASRLGAFLRPSDTLARMGGDEFVVVAEDLPDEQTAVRLGKRFVIASRRPHRVGGHEVSCTVSIGIALATHAGSCAEELLQNADLALYRAKALGRNRAVLFDRALRSQELTGPGGQQPCAPLLDRRDSRAVRT